MILFFYLSGGPLFTEMTHKRTYLVFGVPPLHLALISFCRLNMAKLKVSLQTCLLANPTFYLPKSAYSAYGKQTSWLFLTFKLRTPGTSTMRWRDCTATNHAHFQLNQTSTKQFLEHSVEQKNMISCKMKHDQLSTICKYLPRKLKNPPLWLVEFPAEAPFCQCWALPLPQLHHLFDWKSAPLASAGANDMPLSQFRNVKPQMSAWHVAAIHWSCENCSTQTRTS